MNLCPSSTNSKPSSVLQSMRPNRSADVDLGSPFRCAQNARQLQLNWCSLVLHRGFEIHEDGEYATVINEIDECARLSTVSAMSRRTDTESGPSAAPQTIMDRILRCEREEYERLINDRTHIHAEDSPGTLDVDSSSDSEVQTSEESATNSDLESDSCESTSNRASDMQAYPSDECGVRRAYMLEQQLLSRRRTAHLLALGRLGFPLAGYTIDPQLAPGH